MTLTKPSTESCGERMQESGLLEQAAKDEEDLGIGEISEEDRERATQIMKEGDLRIEATSLPLSGPPTTTDECMYFAEAVALGQPWTAECYEKYFANQPEFKTLLMEHEANGGVLDSADLMFFACRYQMEVLERTGIRDDGSTPASVDVPRQHLNRRTNSDLAGTTSTCTEVSSLSSRPTTTRGALADMGSKQKQHVGKPYDNLCKPAAAVSIDRQQNGKARITATERIRRSQKKMAERSQIDGLRSSDSELSRSLENVQNALTGLEAEIGSLAGRVQLLEHLSARVGTVEDRIQELAASTEAARMATEAARSMAEESTMQSETRARRLQVDVDGRVRMDMLETIVSEKVEAEVAKEKEGIKKNKSAIKRIFSYLEDTVNSELGRLRKDVDEMRELLVHKGSMA